MLDGGHFPAELVFVGFRRLVPDHLFLRLRVLAFGQSRKLLRPDRALESPLLGELTLPLTVALLLPAPVVRFLRSKLAGMVRPGLATGERFGNRQHRPQQDFKPVLALLSTSAFGCTNLASFREADIADI